MANIITANTYDEYCKFAIALAKECGAIARRHYNPDISFKPKGEGSAVTIADLEINRHVIERCRAAYPAIGILGEEESSIDTEAGDADLPGEKASDLASDLLWVCDPIDGTSPYIFGMSASTFCLALVKAGKPVVGVVYEFMNDRLYHAVTGHGAYLNGEPIVQPGYPPLKLLNLEWWTVQVVTLRGFHELMFAKGYQIINYASNSFMSMQVATGRMAGDLYMGKYSWDVAAAAVIAEECGCIVKNIDGADQRYDTEVKGVIIARPECYEEILEGIRAARV